MMTISDSNEKKAGLAYWAGRVLEECDNASAGFAADPVHDLRVAIRRCRSMADGFLSVDPDPAWKQMKRLAKPLFSSLGDLRDTQVMLEWVEKLAPHDDPVKESLTAGLTEKETLLKSAAQETLAEFDRERWAELNEHLAKRTGIIPPEGLVFQHLALERWTDAHELHRRALRNRSGVAYHQLRIGIKRFRYTIENFLPERHTKWSKALRDLQDDLGEVHDFDVLRAMIRAHRNLPPDAQRSWLSRIAGERQKRLDFYRQRMMGKESLWPVWRAELPSGEELEQAGLEKLRSWGAFLDPDVTHSTHVARLALQIYDGLSQCGIPIGRPGDRRILQVAALLHEVGRRKPEDKHGNGHLQRSFRRISKLNPPLTWSEEDMRCVAAAARYHRGKLPVSSNSHFVGLSAKRRSDLLPIIGALRLADALDDNHDESVTQIAAERAGESVVLHAEGLQEMSPLAANVARARYVLEASCGLPMMVRGLSAKVPAVRSAPPSRKTTLKRS